MRNLENLRKELFNKERTIEDLIRYSSTRTDNNPNYSLLLGAGCSVTSGVNPATKLIEIWKKELYLQSKRIPDSEYLPQDVDAFFQQEMWYDPRNPYSALFEKRYDLPRQRRMFVEQEVRDKVPSIGYSYLIKLVENNFFKTIFTTNFDDLINEAFYQFSHQRPLVCAHDSAISSITITSKRPKIIKLHGDYLFDDIKSTLRETESLEENIKNKFSEFAKDYGLIVIGYGGNDRSIVDILNYLLKNEEYFKNGIYWCLRKGSYINEDLRKLLWRDRVYYVEIDGYDELMAEMHSNLNNGELPIDSSYLDKRKDELIENIIGNKFLKDSKNQYIVQDFKKLRNTRNKDIVSNFFKFMENSKITESKSDSFIEKTKVDNFTETQRMRFSELTNEFYIKNYDFGLSQVSIEIENHNDKDRYYLKLLKLKARYLRTMNQKNEAIQVLEEVLKYEPSNIEVYISLSKISSEFALKIDYLERAVLLEPYDSELKYELIILKFNEYELVNNKDELDYTQTDIEELIEQSLVQNPSLSNRCWKLKFRYLRFKKIVKSELISETEAVLETLEKQDPLHPDVVGERVKLMRLNNARKGSIFSYIQNTVSRSISSRQKKYLEFLLLEAYAEENENKLLEEHLLFIETKYQVDDDYLIKKAVFTFVKFKNLDLAIDILESLAKKTNQSNRILFSYYLNDNKLDKAETVLSEISGDILLLKIELLHCQGLYDQSLDIINEKLNIHPSNSSLIVLKSFTLLLKKDYRGAYSYCSDLLKVSNFTDVYLLVNYYEAGRHIDKPIKEQKINDKILSKKSISKEVELAAYALLNDKNRCFNLLRELITKDYSNKYLFRNWPVLEEIIKVPKIEKLFENEL